MKPAPPKERNASEAEQGVVTLGWRELIDFPDWHIRRMVAKLDTGARTGALDVTELEELPGNRVRFAVRLRRSTGEASRQIETAISRRSRVRSAFGQAHDRLFVETTVQIGSVLKKVELGLVCRRTMICRVLLGRKALEGQFLVDSSRRYVLGRKRRKLAPRERGAEPGPAKDVP